MKKIKEAAKKQIVKRQKAQKIKKKSKKKKRDGLAMPAPTADGLGGGLRTIEECGAAAPRGGLPGLKWC
ncbi:hypothetical protein P1O19_004995 [Escherichia coli]|nr:hypothetical protein [Escherichia coli]EKN8157862.1 hypothetical protein [Escherichia coli]EKO9149908.1 hypothetical protein [Escherichia coli]EKO9164567.1 hypothetical protein [Escherichia coli]EKO9317770.1 hypothetical protein [Escherichia coli]